MEYSIQFISYLLLMIEELKELFVKKCKSNNYFYLAIIVISCIISVFVFSSVIHDGVKAENDEILHKYYTVITIEDGDSLWDYADEYGDLGYKSRYAYISEIQSINHLNNINKLISGDTLVLPYYSYEVL